MKYANQNGRRILYGATRSRRWYKATGKSQNPIGVAFVILKA